MLKTEKIEENFRPMFQALSWKNATEKENEKGENESTILLPIPFALPPPKYRKEGLCFSDLKAF